MKEFDRTERIGSELKRELYQVLRDEVRDPRLGNITVQEVRVVRDLSHAKVFFTCFGGEEDAEEQARLLNGRLSGFVRHALAQRVRLRIMPQLHFVYDASILAGEHLSHLIDVAVQGSGAPADAAPDDTADSADAADASSPASSADAREQPQ
jgi:ribosome-binding factor A